MLFENLSKCQLKAAIVLKEKSNKNAPIVKFEKITELTLRCPEPIDCLLKITAGDGLHIFTYKISAKWKIEPKKEIKKPEKKEIKKQEKKAVKKDEITSLGNKNKLFVFKLHFFKIN
jgi:hypothetical protein